MFSTEWSENRGKLFGLLQEEVLETLFVSVFYIAIALGIFEFFSLILGRELYQVSFALSIIGSWRYCWLFVNMSRSYIYNFIYYPKLRRKSQSIAEEYKYPDQLFIIIATLKEKTWVSRRMIHSVLREVSNLPCQTSLFIATGGEDEDDLFRKYIHQHPSGNSVNVYLMRQEDKRSGLAYALRAASRRHRGGRALVVLMDGDSILGADIFKKTLPLFALKPELGALTTNNIAFTRGPRWFRQWYKLRFALRNRYMSSVSLSNKVLTLTGRFSVFRARIAFSEEFLKYLEEDFMDDWLYGRINFLTGDDKSTWFCVLKNKWQMLYVPDAHIFAMEHAGVQPLKDSYAKMRRWFGNMLRNNGRALALGPQKTGLFSWWSLLDQRISIWTTLIGPAAAVLLGIFKSPLYFISYVVWVIATRLVYLLALNIEGHRISLWDLPLLVGSQWGGSIVKIQCMADLRKQQWGTVRNGKKTQGDDSLLAVLQMAIWLLIFIWVTSKFAGI